MLVFCSQCKSNICLDDEFICDVCLAKNKQAVTAHYDKMSDLTETRIRDLAEKAWKRIYYEVKFPREISIVNGTDNNFIALPASLKTYVDSYELYTNKGKGLVIFCSNIDELKIAYSIMKSLYIKACFANTKDYNLFTLYSSMTLEFYSMMLKDISRQSEYVTSHLLYMQLNNCKMTEITRQIISNLLTWRLSENRPTLFTTSMAKNDFESLYGKDIVDLVKTNNKLIGITGK